MADWVPDVSDGARRRLTVALVGGLVVVLLIGAGVTLTSRRAEHEPPPVLPVAAASQTASTSEKTIVVSVVGQVARPGLVTLSEGSRVADALREAGGPVPGVDISALNLARRLADGEQIYVGIPPPPGTDPAPAGAPAAPDKVDLNSATLADLDTLPGVGPVTAQRIVDWRAEHGRFDSVDQLREIDGIGPSRFANLKDMVVAR